MSVDSRFYEHLGPAPLSELAAISGADCQENGGRLAASVGTSATAASDEICYYDGPKPPGEGAINPDAAGCFVQAKFAGLLPTGVVALVSAFPRHAHTLAARRLLRIRGWDEVEQADRPTHIHETASISPGAHIGAGAAIGERTIVGPNAVVGPGVQIGRDCVIGANASVQCALIGNSVKIYSGARIGEAGFGVSAGPSGAEDTPQYGRVILQDGVTVGANSCIDRGAFDDTILGENSKIDNLCQIGHNVVIGRNVMLASFAGISGSVVIGDGVKFGGRVGIADHVIIGENAQIAASAGVFREIPAGETWGGVPARPVRQWMREIAWVQKQTNGGKRKS